MHYAENGGPGAFAHTARNIAIVMDIFKDVEALCPNAWLLNFTNPVPRICLAASRYTNIKVVGICHQVSFGYMVAGTLLHKDLHIDVPEGWRFTWGGEEVYAVERRIAAAAMEKIDIRAAGLNHFTWMLSVHSKESGEDLYPLLWERLRAHDPQFEPLTRDVAETFGLIPVPGDCHLCEYLPYTHNMQRKVWERYDVQMYPLDGADEGRNAMWDYIEAMGSGAESVDPLRIIHSERAEKVIAAIALQGNTYEQALNVPNVGQIANLPRGAMVETPAVVGAPGPAPVCTGDLPEPIAELCRRQIAVAEMCVQAAVEGDRKLALQALALDPMVDDLETARGLLWDYLDAFAEYLPQFA
jgi:alpha-galactosidase